MDKQYEKNMKLKVTIAATAVAMTLQTIIQLQYLLPVYEWCGDIYYPVLGMVQLFVGILIAVCMPMMGWTLYKNREQLPKLRPFMRIEALVICCLIGMLLVWIVVRYYLPRRSQSRSCWHLPLWHGRSDTLRKDHPL